jgi:hypothetical protein
MTGSTVHENRQTPTAASRHSKGGARRRRGTADVELLMTIIIMLFTLFVAWGAGRIARLRLQVSDEAHTAAVRDAIASTSVQDATDSTVNPMTGEDGNSLSDPLPNRVHTTSKSGTITLQVPNGQPQHAYTLTFGGSSISPAWTYTAYPFDSDKANTQSWYENQTGTYHQPLEGPLQLKPVWTP